MGISGSRKTYVPFFDRRNPFFDDMVASGGFSNDVNSYFLERDEFVSHMPWETLVFDIHAFLDILIAPYFVFQKDYNSQFDYPFALVKLFLAFFPSNAEYHSVLQKYYPLAIEYLRDIEVSNPAKHVIVNRYEEIATEVAQMLRLLNSCRVAVQREAYVSASQEALTNLTSILNLSIAKVNITPKQDIAYEYHKHFPENTRANPIGYFIDVIFNNGYERLRNEWKYEDSIHGDFPSFEEYIHKKFEIEKSKCIRFKLEELHDNQYNRRKIITRFCYELDYLVLSSKAKSYPIAIVKIYEELILAVQKVYSPKKYQYPLKHIELHTIDANPIFELKFLNKFISVDPDKNEGEHINLFEPGTDVKHLRSLLMGQYNDLPLLKCNCDPGVFYYFLALCIKDKALFKVPDLKGRVELKDHKPFISRNFRQHLHRLGTSIAAIKKGNLTACFPTKNKALYEKVQMIFR